MKWIKKGLLFCPVTHSEWDVTHAAVPIADHVKASTYRIYFGVRDRNNESQTRFIEIDINDLSHILYMSSNPVLTAGKPGYFDDSGAMPSWIINYNQDKYLYYIGWNTGVKIPFRNAIGLAISKDGGNTFSKYSQGPIMDRSIYDHCFVSNPCILVEQNLWRMWYISCITWDTNVDTITHYYHIKYSESRDGIRWDQVGTVCIDFKSTDEYAISRPSVIKDGNTYKMWYSYRGKTYRIGYAESSDGICWVRKDEKIGIDVSDSGWDSEMIEYPFVFKHDDRFYMLYNGNGYGKTGFGLAILEE